MLTDDLLALPAQVSRLTEQVTALVEAQRRTDAQMIILVEQMVTLTQAVQVLTKDVDTLKTDVGALKGKSLETHYRMHGSPFFGVLLRRPYVLAPHEVAELLDDAVDRGVLSVDESVEIRRADLVVRGTRWGDGTVVYLVVEVSWTVDTDDVERATRRAVLLAKTGLLALPVVAGEKVGPAAARLAQVRRVWQVTSDGVVPPAS